jgi:capsular exopolysaccharide synthesis family protein
VGTSLSGPMTQGHRAFLVTSSGAQEGKTTLAVNLAQVLLQYGRRVLLVDGNLRKPEVARLLGLTGKAGLAEALASQRNPMDYVVDSDGISVLPGGTPPSNPVELLSSPAMSLFLQQAQQRYDVVIIDSPPAVGFAETKAMGKSSGGAILVVKGGSTSIESVREARDEMASAGVPLVGVVLNFAPSEECGHLRHDKYGADI